MTPLERKAQRRPLRDDERSLLNHLLDIDLPGIEELRAQAAKAEALDTPEFFSDVELYIPRDVPPATKVREQVPIRAHSISDENAVDVTLWMDGDYIDRIELAWYDTVPTR